MWVQSNNNPGKALVGDCTIRAISKAINKPWDDTYIYLAVQGFKMKDMPSSNRVWASSFTPTASEDSLFLIHARTATQ